MKKLVALLITLLIVLPACIAEENLREFTDSLGRTVLIPKELTRVAPSGPTTQIVLFALCPERFAGLASDWHDNAAGYIDEEYYDIPVLGTLYGGKGGLNLEELLVNGVQLVIDVGEPRKGDAEELDALQAQTGIPFVHISGTTQTMGDAYRKLGELMGMPEEAETLAGYYEETLDKMTALAQRVEKKKLIYIVGSDGLNVIARDSYHAEIIDLISDNLALVEAPSSKGSGNAVDMEQLLIWNPEVILFSSDSIYDTVGSDANWQSLSAIQSGSFYEVPDGPHNWMGFPPSVQRLLGMLWLGKLLYPEQADYDLYDEVAKYYSLFYHCDLTRAQYDELVRNSIGRIEI